MDEQKLWALVTRLDWLLDRDNRYKQRAYEVALYQCNYDCTPVKGENNEK